MEPSLHYRDSQQDRGEVPLKDCPVRIFAVIVLYKMLPRDSPTLRTLLEASQGVAQLDLRILLWDNTPGDTDPGPLPEGILHVRAPDNPCLAKAYNYARSLAAEHRYTWLLTLDQDSVLPANFLSRISEIASAISSDLDIAAIVPQVTGDGRLLSPFHLVLSGLPRWFPRGFIGIPDTAIFAVNSASMLRIDALQEIGGYDPLFPLDASDLNLFYRFSRAHRRVYVAGDVQVHHDFSLFKQDQRMSASRYQAMLVDECAFWDLYMAPLARAERLLRLTARLIRDALRGKNAKFRQVTISELRRRLTRSRSRRILEWQRWASARCLQRPLISNSE
jgi:GT2 family glycosyltransferase